MFKINKIRIEGFHSAEKIIEYEFSDENVTVIYGENGCGKTTLLQILNAVFSENEDVLTNNKVRNIYLELEDNGSNTVIHISANENEKLRIVQTANEIKAIGGNELNYDWSEFHRLKKQRTILLGVYRGNIQSNVSSSVIFSFIRSSTYAKNIFVQASMARKFAEQLSEYINYNRKSRSRKSGNDFDADHVVLNGNNIETSNIEGILSDSFDEVVTNASANIQSALFTTLSHLIGQKENKGQDDHFKNVQDKLEKYFLLISNAIEIIPESRRDNEILKLLKSENHEMILNECKENPSFCILMSNIIQSLASEMKQFHSIVQLQECFNDYTREDKRMVIDREGIYFEILKEGKIIGKHRVNELSSGEKQLLTILTCLFIDGANRNIIFIDEPELSLNMKWQSKLIDLFAEFAPDTQVILATHSPSIAENHTNCLRKLV